MPLDRAHGYAQLFHFLDIQIKTVYTVVEIIVTYKESTTLIISTEKSYS